MRPRPTTTCRCRPLCHATLHEAQLMRNAPSPRPIQRSYCNFYWIERGRYSVANCSRMVRNHLFYFQWYKRWPPYFKMGDPYAPMGDPNAPIVIRRILNAHIFATAIRLTSCLGLRRRLSGTADRMALFLFVQIYSRKVAGRQFVKLQWHRAGVLLQCILWDNFLPARRYASAGNSDRNVSVRLSVRHAPVLCQNEDS